MVVHHPQTLLSANGIDIMYDAFGQPTDTPLVLIHGLGAQLITWREDFCRQLAQHGLFVIRFDNRDIGLSTKWDFAGIPNVMDYLPASQGQPVPPAPYYLSDMAKDTVGLMNALAINTAHILGVSLGGMIAQTLTINYPERVRTLTSIMSTTGRPSLPMPHSSVMPVFMGSPAKTREAYIEQQVVNAKLVYGPHYILDEDWRRQLAADTFDRGLHPAGNARQMIAALASGSRHEQLVNVTTPTLVIHGDADPVMDLAGGEDTANCIPNATLLVMPGMGHSMPPATWPQIIPAIVEHVRNFEISHPT